MRIIGGAWRSRLVFFPSRQDLRPTPDRVRETLFNWLGQDLTGKSCLDLFAGSGALGFEAASRGARRVVMVEQDLATFRALVASRAALDAAAVELKRADALEFLRATTAASMTSCFSTRRSRPITGRGSCRCCRGTSRRGRWFIMRAQPAPFCRRAGQVHRQGRAGQVTYQLLKRDPHMNNKAVYPGTFDPITLGHRGSDAAGVAGCSTP